MNREKISGILTIALLLAGCSMSNDEIIAQTQKCEAAGMRAVPYAHMWDYHVVKIQCEPRGR